MVTRDEIRQDMIDQLERKNIYGSHYIALIDDYMALWDIKNQLIESIKKHGVTVKYQNGPNQWGYRKNDSVPELNRVSAQMLKILHSMGLRASQFEGGGNRDVEM